MPDAQAPNLIAHALRIQREGFLPDTVGASFERVGEAEVVRIEIFSEEVHARFPIFP
jgi:hypothetical protein